MSAGPCPVSITRSFILHCILTLSLMIVFVVQSTMLDRYIIMNNHATVKHYFWIFPDFILMIGFVWAMSKGYRYCKLEANANAKNQQRKKKPSWSIQFRKYIGHHPVTYTIWFCYSLLLVAKTIIIFKSQILNRAEENSFFGPQLMKILLALTCVIFVLFVQSHQSVSVAESPTRKTFIRYLTVITSLELLDSVTFLTLLIQSESKLLVSFNLENAILFFACINFFLPTLALYKLSLSDFSKYKFSEVITFLYKFLHLFFVNLPFLIIRIHVWTSSSSELSIFVVKNGLHIYITLKDLLPEIKNVYLLLHGWVRKLLVPGVSSDHEITSSTMVQSDLQSPIRLDRVSSSSNGDVRRNDAEC